MLHKAKVLKEQKASAKSRRLNISQNSTHMSHMERGISLIQLYLQTLLTDYYTNLDKLLRPSDRGNDIRQYGKMDADIWKYDTLRDWFNSYATPQPVENWSAIQSGYTIQIDNPPK